MDENIARTIKTKNAKNVTMCYLLLMFNLLIVVYFLEPSILKKSTLERCCLCFRFSILSPQTNQYISETNDKMCLAINRNDPNNITGAKKPPKCFTKSPS